MITTLLLTAGVALPAAASNGPATGAIQGKVVFEGERPEAKPKLKIGAKESEGCVHGGEVDNTDRSLMIHESGGVANVVVTVAVDGVELEVPSEPVVLDQRGCRFEPHVTVVPQGSTVRFGNSDEVNHNVHTYSVKNKTLNNNIAGGSHEDQVFEKEEEIKVTCDIHPWMNSYVVVTEDPFYTVTAADGSFSLEGLPAGSYKISYWHESLGDGKSDEVTVEAGKSASAEIKLGAEKEKKGGRRRRR